MDGEERKKHDLIERGEKERQEANERKEKCKEEIEMICDTRMG